MYLLLSIFYLWWRHGSWRVPIAYWLDLTYLDVLHSLGHGDPLDAGLSPQLLHHHPLLLDTGHCFRIWYPCSVRKLINIEPKQTFYLQLSWRGGWGFSLNDIAAARQVTVRWRRKKTTTNTKLVYKFVRLMTKTVGRHNQDGGARKVTHPPPLHLANIPF